MFQLVAQPIQTTYTDGAYPSPELTSSQRCACNPLTLSLSLYAHTPTYLRYPIHRERT